MRRLSVLAVAGLTVSICLAMSSDLVAEKVDSTRSMIEKWVETRRVISNEKKDWALSRDVLTERLDLVRRETESLRSRISDAEASIAQADGARATLIAERDGLKASSDSLVGTVATLETRVQALLPRLPQPLRDRVQPLSQRLPQDPAATVLSLSERFQNVVGLLNEVNRFNREITVTSEVRSLPDGTSAEVSALYLGIGQGYFVNMTDTAAGVGAGSSAEWQWRQADHAASDIRRAIAILNNEEAAGFVHLPINAE